ncbi:MAG: hypothetical protein HDT46_02065 [Ruminococcaceae bacterium]|nr:hypothetical protein [Oscillospiraceae bacterium]
MKKIKKFFENLSQNLIFRIIRYEGSKKPSFDPQIKIHKRGRVAPSLLYAKTKARSKRKAGIK